MCNSAICQLCMKKSWTGCGDHIEQVMSSTSPSMWCTCRHNFIDGEDLRFPPMAGTGTMRSFSVSGETGCLLRRATLASLEHPVISESSSDNEIAIKSDNEDSFTTVPEPTVKFKFGTSSSIPLKSDSMNDSIKAEEIAPDVSASSFNFKPNELQV